ncbi:MGH1-like glycoside hydrolase domain-containing protein [Labrys okinawensis]|uniref:MGH1-like glycoside hydrolase domain-containing protein n=1 Tax=Labrys okinawensis TaxID=346911 RepID=UPI0039BCB539
MSVKEPHALFNTAEGRRLREIATGTPWRKWGPYLAERQWGTVREDYSSAGDAWRYFPHDHARSRAYRWGEDGLAGFCDEAMRWCLGLALWNGKDAMLKERLFGLGNSEGNHGEDVKEVYHFVDATPTHSYQRMVYRYPQSAFPYEDLLSVNKARSRSEPEYELVDTGAFDDGRFFDVTVEYAKADPDDILMQISIKNASKAPASLDVLPQLWARNTWSWTEGADRPRLRQEAGDVLAFRTGKKTRRLSIDRPTAWLLCENETNTPLLFGVDASGPFKDGINDFVVKGSEEALSRSGEGSKAAAHCHLALPAGGTASLRLRWRPDGSAREPFVDFDEILTARRNEADEFYAAIQSGMMDSDARAVHRQALAGLLWSKQVYLFDVPIWLAGDPVQPTPPAERRGGRNCEWLHLNNADVISMPDTWEYPWYAAWDLAFHCVPLSLIDPAFAKDQLVLLTREWFMHPNGQMPAYEWMFGDVNPPVHAWAALRVYETDRERTGIADTAFLERVLHKLLLNFTWWVNRKDAGGRNLFQGGFLGLDNISPFNRSDPLPDGTSIDQADGTAWMAMYALNLMRIAIELAMTNPVYEDIATKFFEHFLSIAGAMADVGGTGQGLWNDEDGFFYDTLRVADGQLTPIRLRSMVGLIPIFAVEVLDHNVFEKLPGFTRRLNWFLKYRPELAQLVSRWTEPGSGERRLLSLLRGQRLKDLLRRMLDETEFLSDYGIRSMSKAHAVKPYRLDFGGMQIEVPYTPGEAMSGLFGGNSNWRGPIWMPVNFLLIDALRRFYSYFGPEFMIECPSGSSQKMNLSEVADELGRRLSRLFLLGRDGRPSAGPVDEAGSPALIGNHLLFHEYFHGDTGRGLGASHQTGWTALIANVLTPVSTHE